MKRIHSILERVRPSAQLQLPIGHSETLGLQTGQINDRFDDLRQAIWNINADETQRGMALAIAQEVEQRVLQWMRAARPDVELPPMQTAVPEWLKEKRGPGAETSGSAGC